MANFKFSEILERANAVRAAEARRKSWAWYIREIKKARGITEMITAVSPEQAVKDPMITKIGTSTLPTELSGPATIIGKMLLFQYDAKTKAKLPYWDEFPLIFPINIYNDGYLGINLHYLPPVYRAKLMDSLYTLVINKEKMNDKTRLKISYNILNNYAKFRYFQPCVKRYLYSHVKSKWSVIRVTDWDTCLLLPLQRFHKATDSTVWSDSIKKF